MSVGPPRRGTERFLLRGPLQGEGIPRGRTETRGPPKPGSVRPRRADVVVPRCPVTVGVDVLATRVQTEPSPTATGSRGVTATPKREPGPPPVPPCLVVEVRVVGGSLRCLPDAQPSVTGPGGPGPLLRPPSLPPLLPCHITGRDDGPSVTTRVVDHK